MSNFVMPDQVTSLPVEQQKAVHQVLADAGLLTGSGEQMKLNAANMPEKHKTALNASLKSMGVEENLSLFGGGLGCIAARLAEVAAVAACSTLAPSGPIVVAACVAAAHAVADAQCN